MLLEVQRQEVALMTQLVLSLFPGADLLGRAFEIHGASVVRGPEILLGQDVDVWPLPPPGRFDGLIAGPPCQSHSLARNIGGFESKHRDYVADCFKWARVMGVRWAVVENVPNALASHPIPDQWGGLILDDWQCGGNTMRKRLFYVYPRELVTEIPPPPERNGGGEYSVLASSNKPERSGRRHGSLTPKKAGQLQGWPEIVEVLESQADIGKKGNCLIGARLIVHYLGNGVPRAMGEWIAKHVLNATRVAQ